MPERWQRELRALRTVEPPVDLWDRVMLGPRRQPPAPHRAWRFAAPVAAALAVVMIAGGLGLAGVFTSAPPLTGSAAGGRFTDPRFGWTIDYPGGMRLAHFQSQGRLTTDGARITSFPPNLESPGTGVPPMGWLRDFPAGGVAVQIWFGERLLAPPPLHDSAFPLRPATFNPVARYAGGSEPIPRYRSFYADGFAFSAAVWIGRHASRASQEAAWAVVKSLRFPAVRTGTIWQGSYYVLGGARQYRTGSVTAFPPGSLPRGLTGPSPRGFYLVHAPDAFYVVGQVFQNPTKPSVKCSVAFDRKAFQFFCPSTGWRWDRAGQPAGPTPRGQDWVLPLHVATVAHDGHVLFSPFYGGLLPGELLGSPWGDPASSGRTKAGGDRSAPPGP
jgi:hypothetical protein